MRRLLLTIAALALPLAGCGASRTHFEPAERVQGQTLQGQKVAIYPLAVGTGPFGEAKLWSRGAYEAEGGRGVVHVGLEIHNTGSTPIELRPGDVQLDVLDADDGPIKGLRPVEDRARTFVPGAIGEAGLHFELPHGVSPGDVSALRLHWRLHVNGQTYAQRTPFVEEVEPTYGGGPPHYAYPCWPYGPYDCMYMHPYGYRFDGPVIVPRHAVPPPSRTSVRPRR